MDEIDGKNGVKIAASRRAKFECGLNLSPREISHVARIIYSSDCSEIFSENELDHCLVSKTNHQLNINADEISNIKVIVFSLKTRLYRDHFFQNIPISRKKDPDSVDFSKKKIKISRKFCMLILGISGFFRDLKNFSCLTIGYCDSWE